MKFLIKYLIFPGLLLLFSCDKSFLFVICSDCVTEEPRTTNLEIKVDEGNEIINSETIINIYSGNLEDNTLLATISETGKNLVYTATLNKKYTVTATYFIRNVSYTAVDSAYPRVKYDSDSCSDPCYIVYDNKVDLRLKYIPR